jgi:hypothetical protein
MNPVSKCLQDVGKGVRTFFFGFCLRVVTVPNNDELMTLALRSAIRG